MDVLNSYIPKSNPVFADQSKIQIKSKNFSVINLNDRPWQIQCLEELENEKNCFIVASPGAGKSTVALALLIKRIDKSDHKKGLIVVPETHIGNGFKIPKISINGEIFISQVEDHRSFVDIPTNYVVSKNNKKETKTSELKKFLLTNYKKVSSNEMIGVVSRAALMMIWEELTEDQKKTAVHNTIFAIDEAHFLCGVGTESDFANKLAGLCGYSLADDTSELILMTATPMRNGVLPIVNNEFKNSFKKYTRELHEHLDEMNIDHVQIRYEKYSDVHPIQKLIQNIKDERNEHHFIVVPSSNSLWRSIDNRHLNMLKSELRKIYSDDEIIDFVVDPSVQKTNKERLLNEKENNQIKVVITCRLGLCGTDWTACSRIHDTVAFNSHPLQIQILGRTFRGYPSKSVVKKTYYIQNVVSENLLDLVNDRTNMLFLGMMLDDCYINPIKVSYYKKRDGTVVKTNPDIGFNDFFGDRFQDVLNLSIKACVNVPKINESIIEAKVRPIVIKHIEPFYADDTERAVAELAMRIGRIFKKSVEGIVQTSKDFIFDSSFFRQEMGFANMKDEDEYIVGDYFSEDIQNLQKIAVKINENPKKYFNPLKYFASELNISDQALRVMMNPYVPEYASLKEVYDNFENQDYRGPYKEQIKKIKNLQNKRNKSCQMCN